MKPHAALLRVLSRLLLATCVAGFMLSNVANADSTTSCVGRTFNPISDVCWSCMMPFSIGSADILNEGDQVDIENPASPICICPAPPPIFYQFGLSIGFWEPSYLVEVPRAPWCFPTLGGITVHGNFAPAHGRTSKKDSATKSAGSVEREVFYQTHVYSYPLLYILGVSSGNPCLHRGALELTYLTELDPSWDDPAWSSVFNFEASLFANPIALAACGVDCVAATASMSLQPLFWCAGCQGSMYPTEGFVPHHHGGVDTSLLLTERIMYKMHKEFIADAYHGELALCTGGYPEPVMDKRAYKTQMVYPIPNTLQVAGKCCLPMGASSVPWNSGKEFPIIGEDFGYLLFRKRNCCVLDQ
jgi:conjugal transfer pilus assembly protein TraU